MEDIRLGPVRSKVLQCGYIYVAVIIDILVMNILVQLGFISIDIAKQLLTVRIYILLFKAYMTFLSAFIVSVMIKEVV